MIKSAAPVALQITIGKGQGQITGVALRDGRPLAGVMIVAVPNDPAHNQVLFRRDQSDSTVLFLFPPLSRVITPCSGLITGGTCSG